MGIQVTEGWNSFILELKRIFSSDNVGIEGKKVKCKNNSWISESSCLTASWVWDKKNDQVFIENAEKIFGCKPWEDMYSPSYWRRKIHNKDYNLHKQAIDKCLNNELSNFEIDLRLRAKYGRYICLTCKGRVILNNEGKVIELFGTYTLLQNKN